MNAQEFCYWLQGYVEMGGEAPTSEQWDMIKSHLQLVFNKVTPELGETKKQTGWEDKKIDPTITDNILDKFKKIYDKAPPDPITHPFVPTYPTWQPPQPTWLVPDNQTGRNPLNPTTITC